MAKNRYVADERQEEYEENDVVGLAFEEPAGDYEAGGEPRCPHCGELLAWHEALCSEAPIAPPAEEEKAVITPASSGYAYELGHRVQPPAAREARAIIWRGQLRERHPQTGMVHRVPVYRLDDGYWDCYREEELLVA